MITRNKSMIILLMVLLMSITAQAEDRLFRFPDVSSEMITFSHGGDLWTVPISGGLARRITSHEGLEIFPRFSPDGKQIAFTGQYDGNTHVYFMPTNGGEPVRLTYHPAIAKTSERMGPEHIVMDWTSDGKEILFRSRRGVSDVWSGKLCLVSTTGGLPRFLPVPSGGFASFSPDESKIAYCPKYRDFRTWKRYKGGMAQDVYIYDLTSFEREKITDWVGTDNMPMWSGNKIYFNSDRTGTLNIFVYDISSEQIRQITDFTKFDVRWPALGPEHIVFENGGYIYILDLATEDTARVSISLGSDRKIVRPEYINVSKNILDYSLSPDGMRALFCARGEVFTVPAENGNTRNLSNSNGVNEKYPVWSPDGKNIAYISDQTGEDEIYLIQQDGNGDPIKLTDDRDCYKFHLRCSPDSKKIAYGDAYTGLHILDVSSKQITVADEGMKTRINDYNWSPDSRWLTYTKLADNTRIRSVFLYSLHDNQVFRVTDGSTNDYSPIFDPEGRYLYMLSDRNFNAALGRYEFNFVFNGMTGIYVLLLSEDLPSPFAPKSDEVDLSDDKDNKKSEDDDSDKKVQENIKIDLENLSDRITTIPVEPGNYNRLFVTSNRVYYFSNPYGGLSGKKGTQEKELRYYDWSTEEDKLFSTDVDNFNISADQNKMLLKSGDKFVINDASSDSGKLSKGILNLDGMDMYLDRKSEYQQMFSEVWRRMRDLFYDPNMHGVDWLDIRKRYAELVPYASHRFDLIYIIGEMLGEVCCSHTYVGGGDYIKPKSDKTALLGIEFQPDEEVGLYRIGKILQGKNWEEKLRSPLTEPGIEVEEGFYIFEIDGKRLELNTNPYKLLVNKADRQVKLRVGETTDLKKAFEIEVRPISDENKLWYYNWVEERRRIVDSLTGGRLGYIHIPDMMGFGLNEFAKQFYHLYKKEGLVIDVRYNGGGFVSQLTLDRLRRVVVGVGSGRYDYMGTYPSVAFHGHMVCLINEFSCSDGDIFPNYFREYGLGKLIGKRTWGGVIGISGFRPLTDGGFVTVPGGGSVNLDGDWIMENVGVEPDIEFEQTPSLVMQGRDPQLEEAVRHVLDKLENEPVKPLPSKPGPPDKKGD
jgi:tricorn protease